MEGKFASHTFPLPSEKACKSKKDLLLPGCRSENEVFCRIKRLNISSGSAEGGGGGRLLSPKRFDVFAFLSAQTGGCPFTQGRGTRWKVAAGNERRKLTPLKYEHAFALIHHPTSHFKYFSANFQMKSSWKQFALIQPSGKLHSTKQVWQWKHPKGFEQKIKFQSENLIFCSNLTWKLDLAPSRTLRDFNAADFNTFNVTASFEHVVYSCSGISFQ